MKNSSFIVSLLLVLSLTASAQTIESIFIKSGIRIATRTEAVLGAEKIIVKPLDEIEIKDGKDILHRKLIDTKNGTYMAYDIEVSRHSEPDKFNMTIRSGFQKSENNSPINETAQKAEAEKDPRLRALDTAAAKDSLLGKTLTVKSGDIIKFEVLENPDKKYSITDYIKIYDDANPFARSFSELQPTKDFTLDDVTLKLEDFQIFINGKLAGKMGGGGYGPSIYFTVPNRGRIIVSPFPREGFNLQKIGNIIDNKLTFTLGADKYEIVSKSLILGDSGNWNAWILADPNYKKTMTNPKNPDSIQFGAGNLEGFFRKDVLNNLEK